MSSRHMMRKTPALSWSQGWFWVMLCVCKHNKEACLSVSTGLLGTNQRDSDSVCFSIAWEERKEMTGVQRAGWVRLRRETSWGQKPCSSHVRPGEDSGNEKPCIRWLAMPQSQHFEGRPKALWVENTILNKSTFPFCAPDIIKNPWITNAHPQKLHRQGKCLWASSYGKSTYLFLISLMLI